MKIKSWFRIGKYFSYHQQLPSAIKFIQFAKCSSNGTPYKSGIKLRIIRNKFKVISGRCPITLINST